MKKKIQINVVGKESTENVIKYNDLIKCNICEMVEYVHFGLRKRTIRRLSLMAFL